MPTDAPAARKPREDEAPTPWSIRVGRYFGIPVRIHFTFLLLLVWVGLQARSAGREAIPQIILILLLFACVVLHEFGHAGVARLFGVKTKDIVLYPIGGVARLENMPSGRAELLIALAGPAVNLFIVVVLLGVMLAVGAKIPITPEGFARRAGIVQYLVVANLSLFLFNLLPAFPMDGGRVLRAALTFFTSEERATRIAAAIGQTFAVGFFVLWLFQPAAWWLALIGLFVFLGAGQEAAYQTRRAMVRGRSAREAMLTRFDVLAPQDTLGRAAELLLATSQQDFPVVDAWNRVVGILPRSLLLQGLAQAGREAAVLDVMRREPKIVASTAPLDEVLRALQADPGVPVVVSDGEGIAGMITLENLAEFIEIARRTR